MAFLTWTGNPWVDTGLAVIIAKSNKDKIEDITEDDFEAVFSDKTWLGTINRKLKAFTMVVGINSPLTNTSINPSLKKENRGKLNPLDDPGFKQYCEIIDKLKQSVIDGTDTSHTCESCGERPASEVLKAYNKAIARDWFPLAGSIGSDAQMLPAASRTARICSLCLLSVQLIPLAAIIIGGKIACFQSTYPELVQLIVREIYSETLNKLDLLKNDAKISAIGQGKGSKEALITLIKIMGELQRNKRILELPRHTSLNIWLFTNSGQEPDCESIEIPNTALTFLWEATKGYRSEIETILRNEPKKIDQQLLECIKRKTDYYGFYPYKTAKSASKGLFEIYQTIILGNDSNTLRLAEWLANQIKLKLSNGDKNDKKLLSKLVKENTYGNKDKNVLSKLNGIIAELAEDGMLSLEDYTLLFPLENKNPLSTKKDCFRWLWFYLNHNDKVEYKPKGGNDLFTHPMVKAFAQDTFDYYLKKKGMKYIKKNLIDSFKKGEILTSDLQRWFLNLAEINDGYTNEAWDDLCRDEKGNNVTHEVRFQFRLEIANLYRLTLTKENI